MDDPVDWQWMLYVVGTVTGWVSFVIVVDITNEWMKSSSRPRTMR